MTAPRSGTTQTFFQWNSESLQRQQREIEKEARRQAAAADRKKASVFRHDHFVKQVPQHSTSYAARQQWKPVQSNSAVQPCHTINAGFAPLLHLNSNDTPASSIDLTSPFLPIAQSTPSTSRPSLSSETSSVPGPVKSNTADDAAWWSFVDRSILTMRPTTLCSPDNNFPFNFEHLRKKPDSFGTSELI